MINPKCKTAAFSIDDFGFVKLEQCKNFLSIFKIFNGSEAEKTCG